jgi:anti-sigma factor RsiW
VTCAELADFLMAYLDRELDSVRREVFEEHVRLCPPCLDYLESYRKTVELGRSICEDPDGTVPEDVPEDLVQAVLAARARRP